MGFAGSQFPAMTKRNIRLCRRLVRWHALRYSEGRSVAAIESRPSEYLRACHPTPVTDADSRKRAPLAQETAKKNPRAGWNHAGKSPATLRQRGLFLRGGYEQPIDVGVGHFRLTVVLIDDQGGAAGADPDQVIAQGEDFAHL